MSVESCSNAIFEALGGNLSKEEVSEIVKTINARAKRYDMPFDDAADLFMNDIVRELKAARNRKLDSIIKRSKRSGFFKEATASGIGFVDAMKGKLFGTTRNLREGRLGVDQFNGKNQRLLISKILNGLDKTDMKILRDRSLEREIMLEMGEFKEGGKLGISKNKQAIKIAKVLRDVNRASLEMLNRAGANVAEIDGYIMRQSHSAEAIGKVKFDVWFNDIMPLLNHDKTFKGLSGTRIRKSMRGVYDDIITGRSQRALGVAESDEVVKILGSGVNVGKRVSKSRTLHFKDGGRFFDYNQKYGPGGLDKALANSIRQTSRNAALMQIFGPNPRSSFELDIKRFEAENGRLSVGELKTLNSAFDVAEGISDIPGRNAIARISQAESFLQNTSKLGGATISSITDLPQQASNLAAKTGDLNIFKQLNNVISTTFDVIANPVAKKEALEITNIGMDILMGNSGARFTGEDAWQPGMLTDLTQGFFRITGLAQWTEANKAAHAVMFAKEMGLRSGKRFGELNVRLQNSFRNAGIEVREWEVARLATTETKSFGNVVSAEGVRDVPNAKVESILAETGVLNRDKIRTDRVDALKAKAMREASAAVPDSAPAGTKTAKVKAAREQFDLDLKEGKLDSDLDSYVQGRVTRQVNKFKGGVEDKVATYLNDQAEFGTLTPGAFEKHLAYRGEPNDTAMGAALRALWRFKFFPLSVVTKQLPNLVFSGGAKSFTEAIKDRGTQLILGQFIAGMTAGGYMAMTVKDALKGKSPRDPNKASTWRQAFFQGGALGLFGDATFGDYDKRAGRSFLASAVGPTFGQFDDVATLWSSLWDGDPDAKTATRLLINNTPGGNIWWHRGVLDWAVLHNLNEMHNPGYMRNYKRRLSESTGSTIIEPLGR